MVQTTRAMAVDVTGGRVEGILLRGLRHWRGIPYAAPPVGELRFRAPAPVVPWDGVRSGAEFGAISPQDGRVIGVVPGARVPMAEDSLTLNVIAPATDAHEPRPVMVYVHGGAYALGSSRDTPGQGEGLVHDGGVVFVNLNYRLGSLGWLDLSRYATPERPIESNLGLRDVKAALEWVRDNISEFGGDPDNVTLFGESAGANAVTTLMTVPSAHGLFARAIAESSPVEAVYVPATTAEWAEDFVRILREQLGPRAEGLGDQGLLLTATASEHVTATSRLTSETPDRVPGTIALCPVIDGDFLPERPTAAFADGSAARIPLIIGTNDREGSLFRGRLDILASTPSRIQAVMAKTRRSAATELARLYPGLHRRRAAADFAGDHAFWFPSILAAEGHSRYAPVYACRFDIAPRLARLLGLDATHGIELFAVFDLARGGFGRVMGALGGYRDFERVGRRMRTNWLRFAYRGTVDAGWPRYDEEHRRTLIIDAEDRVEEDPRGERRRAWGEFVPHV